MDGWITIGTKLETDKFDKQIKQLEDNIKKEEQKAEVKISVKASQEKELERETQKVDKLMAEYDKLLKLKKEYQKAQKIVTSDISNLFAKDIMDANMTMMNLEGKIGATDTGRFTKIEKMEEQITLAVMKQEALRNKIKKTDEDYQGILNKVEEYRQKINAVNVAKMQEGVNKLKDSFNGVGSSIQNAIHKVSKLALGVFGIRSAFLAVRRASSELASYNPQYSANLEYIRYALTQLIAPVLEYIVNLAKTVLAYINYIANAWFGVNLFAKASAASFKKVKNNIGGASSAAKELQKILAGFDEMNILNSSSTGGGGGVGGSVGPDFDLSDLDAVEIPEWIKWIADNKDIVVGAIKAIAEAFLIFKVLQVAKILSGISGSVLDVIKGLTGFQKFMLGLGIAAIVLGIVTAVESLIKWIKDPTWENFRGVIGGLSLAVTGLGIALLSINKSNPFGWVAIAIGAIGGLITLIGNLVKANDDEAKKVEMVRKAEEALKEARDKLKTATDEYIDAVDRAEDAEKKLKEAQDETGISIDDLLDYMDKENKTYKDLDENQRKVYKAYVNNTNAQDNLKTSTQNLTDAQEQERNKLWELVATFQTTSSNINNYKKQVVQAYTDGKISAKDAADAIGIAMNSMDEKTRQSFVKDIPDAVKQGLNPNQYTTAANSFNNWWGNVLNQVKQKSDGIFGGISNSIYRTLQAAKNMNIGSSSGFSVGGYVTKMASGGIINMPNRGVPVARAIAGEAGHEGIIPLTDQQAMAQLGAEIGRNVLVNLTNITSMNGRVISRELKNIRSEQNFAYNM